MFKNIVKKIIPSKFLGEYRKIKGLYFDGFSFKSYSQEGEDLILKRIFGDRVNGFYVDVGAFHPFWISNTNIFYKNGWRGINIDAMPSSMNLFNKFRPRDINLECPISDKEEILMYYAFNDPALNGFSRNLSEIRNSTGNWKIIFQEEMKTKRLEKILDEYLPKEMKIDFMSIDVEGLDYAVLQSNNWKKYRPEVVLVEMLGASFDDVISSKIGKYMESNGYKIFAKTANTVFFR